MEAKLKPSAEVEIDPIAGNFKIHLYANECAIADAGPVILVAFAHVYGREQLGGAVFAISRERFSNQLKNFRAYLGRMNAPKVRANLSRWPIISSLAGVTTMPVDVVGACTRGDAGAELTFYCFSEKRLLDVAKKPSEKVQVDSIALIRMPHALQYALFEELFTLPDL